MRKLVPFALPSWMLPLVVLAIVVPSTAGFALVGPQLGLAMGALTVAVILVLAARARYDEEIEVASAPDGRYRLLVVTSEALDDPELIDEIDEIASAGASSTSSAGGPAELLVVAPAPTSSLDRWASDLAAARDEAQRVLAISLGSLAAAGLEAGGRVGDADPVQAVEDELHSFAAREVVLVAGPVLGAAEVEEVRRRLDRPVRELERASPAGPPTRRA